MRVLITGAAGNLGGFLARHLAGSDLQLRLMVHRTPLAEEIAAADNVEVVQCDLGRPDTLGDACTAVQCIVHFAGVLFAPRPAQFLPVTNTRYARHLIEAATAAGVERFILISFPHVEGPTSPQNPATDRIDRTPVSVHARTRLEEERALLAACTDSGMTPVILRTGMIYGRGVLMVDYARKLLRRRLLGVWPQPTWIHLIALRDLLDATERAIREHGVRGIYNLGDEEPLTLQAFLDRAAQHWGLQPPWRAPRFVFRAAAACVEAYALLFGTRAPITRDFIRIGMVPYAMDTARMRAELLPNLTYPTLEQGAEQL